MLTLHDGSVVVDLAGIPPRITAEMVEILTYFDALQALAAQTAAGLPPGLIRCVHTIGFLRFHGRYRHRLCQAHEETSGLRTFLLPSGRERGSLQETVNGRGGLPALKGPADR
ncbi:MAG: hypothetical protein BWY79_00688 [Actinobacteria bacterium ADurb.Bin444]|nr:MAG: hypothetical protein BWY79_00688 [Actinobacteria bacterium ADurb.Bin444]